MHTIAGSVGLYFFLKAAEFSLLLGMTVYWLNNMYRLLMTCHPVARTSEPGLVWLTFIPVFGFFWQFMAVKNVSDTLVREYHRRGWHLIEKRPAMELGIVTCVVVCVVFLIRMIFPLYPVIGFFGTLFICFFMWRHSDELISYRERPEKEMDKSTAFGQIPYVNPNNPFANYANPYPQNPYHPPVQQQPFNSYQPPVQQQPFHSYQPPVQPPPYNPYTVNTSNIPPVPEKEEEDPFAKYADPPAQNPNSPPQPINPFPLEDEKKKDEKPSGWSRWAPKK